MTGGALALAMLTVSAVSTTAAASNSGATRARPSSTARQTLTVMLDSTRLPSVALYEKAHPNIKVNAIVYDGNASGDLQGKLELWNRAGSGWPDVVYDEVNSDASFMADKEINFALPLNGLIPNSVIQKFSPGSQSPCLVGGKRYCIRDSLAQDVTWYNAKLFKEFGYRVPTTWQQYQALGKKLAAQHPGYVIGSLGAGQGTYLMANKCPMNELVGPNTVKIDVTAPQCTQMARLLDPLIANKTVSTTSALAAGFSKTYKNKVLMLEAASWFGQYVFAAKSGLDVPPGQIGAAPPLKWAGSPTPTTGQRGGGIWTVSSHAPNAKLAASFVQWVTTSLAYESAQPTDPAYMPAAKAWMAKVQQSHYFVDNLAPVFAQAAEDVWTGYGPVRFSARLAWANTVLPKLVAGQSLLSALPAYQRQLVGLAESQGYKVES